MGCNCGGKRAGMKYQVKGADGKPAGAPKASISEAQKAVADAGKGATFQAVRA